jgi:hypothetical protein
LERLGAAWSGLERLGAAWSGLERLGAAWSGLERLGAAWSGLERLGAARYSIIGLIHFIIVGVHPIEWRNAGKYGESMHR